MRKFLSFLSILIFCIILSGNYSLFNIIFSSIVAIIILLCSVRLDLFTNHRKKSYLHLTSIFYFIWLIVEILKSSIKLTKIIWSLKLQISPRVSWIKATSLSVESKVIYACSITLTPGTITLKIKDDELLVHALLEDEIDLLKRNDMKNKIEYL